MKLHLLLTTVLLTASLCVGAVLANVAASVPVTADATGVTTRTVLLTYRHRAPDATADRTRQLVVEIPNSIVYKNTYLRQFVGNYIGTFNLEVGRVADSFLAHKEGPFWKENEAMYKAEKLKPIRDLDALAPADAVPPTAYDSVHAGTESTKATNAAELLARTHVHDLLKKERK